MKAWNEYLNRIQWLERKFINFHHQEEQEKTNHNQINIFVNFCENIKKSGSLLKIIIY